MDVVTLVFVVLLLCSKDIVGLSVHVTVCHIVEELSLSENFGVIYVQIPNLGRPSL